MTASSTRCSITTGPTYEQDVPWDVSTPRSRHGLAVVSPHHTAARRSESPPFSIERHKDRRNQDRTTTRCARRRRRNTSTPSQQMSRKTALLHRLKNVNSVRGERSISLYLQSFFVVDLTLEVAAVLKLSAKTKNLEVLTSFSAQVNE